MKDSGRSETSDGKPGRKSGKEGKATRNPRSEEVSLRRSSDNKGLRHRPERSLRRSVAARDLSPTGAQPEEIPTPVVRKIKRDGRDRPESKSLDERQVEPEAKMRSSQWEEMPDEISVSVYLDTDDPATITTVLKHLDDLVEALGYDGPIGAITERGSFIRNSLGRIRRSLTSEDAKELGIQARRAIEIITLDRQQADVDNKIADTLSKLVTSLSDVPSASIQAGSILLIKYPGPQGPEVQARNLSQVEIRALERFPEIQRDPRKALQSLALAVSDMSEPEPNRATFD